MNVKSQDINDVTIKGVNVKFTDTGEAYKEDFFEWTAFQMCIRDRLPMAMFLTRLLKPVKPLS